MIPDTQSDAKKWTLVVTPLDQILPKEGFVNRGAEAEIRLRRYVEAHRDRIQLLQAVNRDPSSPCMARIIAVADEVQAMKDALLQEVSINSFEEKESPVLRLVKKLPTGTKQADIALTKMVDELWGKGRVVVHFNKVTAEATIVFPETAPASNWAALENMIDNLLIELQTGQKIA